MGLAEVYPPEHADLAEEVAAAGALIGESAMRQQPIAGLFPQGNPRTSPSPPHALIGWARMVPVRAIPGYL